LTTGAGILKDIESHDLQDYLPTAHSDNQIFLLFIERKPMSLFKTASETAAGNAPPAEHPTEEQLRSLLANYEDAMAQAIEDSENEENPDLHQLISLDAIKYAMAAQVLHNKLTRK